MNMLSSGIRVQWGKGYSSALQQEGMETHRTDKLVLDMSGFQIPDQSSEWH